MNFVPEIEFVNEIDVIENTYRYDAKSPSFKKLISSETYRYVSFMAMELSSRVDTKRVSVSFFGGLLNGYKIMKTSDIPQFDYSEGFPAEQLDSSFWYAHHPEDDILVAQQVFPPKSTTENIAWIHFRKTDIERLGLISVDAPLETILNDSPDQPVKVVTSISSIPEPMPTDNHCYMVEIRMDKGLDVYFDSEKSLVTGKPAELLLTLIEHQGEQLDFRYFSAKPGDQSKVYTEDSFYETSIYESPETALKKYQKDLNNLFDKRSLAIESDNRKEIDAVISELGEFKTALEKEYKATIDDDGNIIMRRYKLKPEAAREVNRLVKQKSSLLNQLQPNTKAHFQKSIKTGVKVSYSPEQSIDWKTIQ